MSLRVIEFRVVRTTAISLLTLLLLAFVVIRFQQHVVRRRAERLVVDFHSIRLNQTTWPEAKAMMQAGALTRALQLNGLRLRHHGGGLAVFAAE